MTTAPLAFCEAPSTLHSRRLSATIGARVTGVDLSQPLPPADREALWSLLLSHKVLVFPGQHLDADTQVAFARQFGDLTPSHPVMAAFDDDHPEVWEIDSYGAIRNDVWHTDVTFIETPPLGAVLAARKLPHTGGDTIWASGSTAYESLSAPLRSALDGLTATHEFIKSFPVERFGKGPQALALWEKARKDNPPVSHPVVRTHPVTKRKSLFVNEGFTTRINELEAAESEAVLRLLFAHLAKPEHSVRWRWQEGDVAFWDNRSTLHYAVDDYRPAHRIMHRATIMGDRPY